MDLERFSHFCKLKFSLKATCSFSLFRNGFVKNNLKILLSKERSKIFFLIIGKDFGQVYGHTVHQFVIAFQITFEKMVWKILE